MNNNMFFYKKGQGGFFQAIVLIIIALVVLGFFGLNIQTVFDSPTVKKNLGYAWGLVKTIWNNLLAKPARFIWDKVIIGLGLEGLKKLKDAIPGKADQVVPAN